MFYTALTAVFMAVITAAMPLREGAGVARQDDNATAYANLTVAVISIATALALAILVAIWFAYKYFTVNRERVKLLETLGQANNWVHNQRLRQRARDAQGGTIGRAGPVVEGNPESIELAEMDQQPGASGPSSRGGNLPGPLNSNPFLAPEEVETPTVEVVPPTPSPPKGSRAAQKAPDTSPGTAKKDLEDSFTEKDFF